MPWGADRSFDVFLSYSARDRRLVERVARALQRDRLSPWLDVWCLTPGGAWQTEIADGLRCSDACAVFVGPDDLGPWERLEVGLALDRAAQQPAFRVFPVLLPGLDAFDPNTLPPFLRLRTWVDLRRGVEHPDGIQALHNAIRGVPFGSGFSASPEKQVCPYRGLQVFEERHSPFFFGRDADVQRLLERLRDSRFVVVLGDSGSGKSSLVRAGLIPALRADWLEGGNHWEFVLTRPGADPLAAIGAALLTVAAGDSMQTTVDGLLDDRRTLHLGVSLALSERPPEARIAIAVDQFEEIFTLCEHPRARRACIENLIYAATVPGGRTVIVLVLRSDFYPRLADFAELGQLAQSNQTLLGPLGTEALRDVIETPAYLAGLQVEAGLADTVIADAGSAPGVLPLLEHALLETWERRRGQLLTLEGYRASGGVHGALAERAEEIYHSLPAEQRSIARSLLLRLTQPGERTEDTRRRVFVDEVTTALGNPTAVATAMRRLADARLLTFGAGPTDTRGWVEVAHEALIRAWPRFRRWIDDEREALRVQRRLTDAAHEWSERGRDRSLLYRGRRLTEALECAERDHGGLTATERRFLTVSVRRRRLARGTGATGLLLMMVALTWLAVPHIRERVLRYRAVNQGPMAQFTAGEVTLGSPRGTAGRHTVRVHVATFAIELYEVSNARYRLCMRAGRCSRPIETFGQTRRFDELPPNLPVVNLTATQADVFCRWLGRRLPSEAEWERAARGTSERPWPWGRQQPTSEHAVGQLGGRPVNGPAAVADRAHGRGSTPEGVRHLAGNVREFTATPEDCKPNQYACRRSWDARRAGMALATRGAGWDEPVPRVSGSDATPVDPNVYFSDAGGARCARSL